MVTQCMMFGLWPTSYMTTLLTFHQRESFKFYVSNLKEKTSQLTPPPAPGERKRMYEKGT